MSVMLAATFGAVFSALLLTAFAMPAILGLGVVATFAAMLTLVLVVVGGIGAALVHAMSGLGRLV